MNALLSAMPASPTTASPKPPSPTTASPQTAQPEESSVHEFAAALVSSQNQIAELLHVLSDEQYVRKSVGHVTSSIGAHIRHCLDHVTALVAGVESGQINYDHRGRGTEIEHNRVLALDAIDTLGDKLCELASSYSDLPLRLTALAISSSPPLTVRTSLGRELAFVLSHTIHHCSLIAVVAKSMGVSVPQQFGYAPATLAFLEQRPCAR